MRDGILNKPSLVRRVADGGDDKLMLVSQADAGVAGNDSRSEKVMLKSSSDYQYNNDS